jgi:hypothetical protein
MVPQQSVDHEYQVYADAHIVNDVAQLYLIPDNVVALLEPIT